MWTTVMSAKLRRPDFPSGMGRVTDSHFQQRGSVQLQPRDEGWTSASFLEGSAAKRTTTEERTAESQTREMTETLTMTKCKENKGGTEKEKSGNENSPGFACWGRGEHAKPLA